MQEMQGAHHCGRSSTDEERRRADDVLLHLPNMREQVEAVSRRTGTRQRMQGCRPRGSPWSAPCARSTRRTRQEAVSKPKRPRKLGQSRCWAWSAPPSTRGSLGRERRGSSKTSVLFSRVVFSSGLSCLTFSYAMMDVGESVEDLWTAFLFRRQHRLANSRVYQGPLQSSMSSVQVSRSRP